MTAENEAHQLPAAQIARTEQRAKLPFIPRNCTLISAFDQHLNYFIAPSHKCLELRFPAFDPFPLRSPPLRPPLASTFVRSGAPSTSPLSPKSAISRSLRLSCKPAPSHLDAAIVRRTGDAVIFVRVPILSTRLQHYNRGGWKCTTRRSTKTSIPLNLPLIDVREPFSSIDNHARSVRAPASVLKVPVPGVGSRALSEVESPDTPGAHTYTPSYNDSTRTSATNDAHSATHSIPDDAHTPNSTSNHHLHRTPPSDIAQCPARRPRGAFPRTHHLHATTDSASYATTARRKALSTQTPHPKFRFQPALAQCLPGTTYSILHGATAAPILSYASPTTTNPLRTHEDTAVDQLSAGEHDPCLEQGTGLQGKGRCTVSVITATAPPQPERNVQTPEHMDIYYSLQEEATSAGTTQT
ncbi:hypothetical protein Hypma_014736 [Hypsizygus marmoreus]|uniref:Uncharacterized protein n=1 Tax=Hypsizygus marmoreus TaxID=39966 RepID=A0A369J9H7_HYPMA|nr:hypothetical protein Hypma_014736 [Hypsizygus marmoreus]